MHMQHARRKRSRACKSAAGYWPVPQREGHARILNQQSQFKTAGRGGPWTDRVVASLNYLLLPKPVICPRTGFSRSGGLPHVVGAMAGVSGCGDVFKNKFLLQGPQRGDIVHVDLRCLHEFPIHLCVAVVASLDWVLPIQIKTVQVPAASEIDDVTRELQCLFRGCSNCREDLTCGCSLAKALPW